MNIVLCCLLCTSIADECCKQLGNPLNSSAITRIEHATRTIVVKNREPRRIVHLKIRRSIGRKSQNIIISIFYSTLTYFGKITAWQKAMNNQITKQHVMFDLNMSSRSWQNYPCESGSESMYNCGSLSLSLSLSH